MTGFLVWTDSLRGWTPTLIHDGVDGKPALGEYDRRLEKANKLVSHPLKAGEAALSLAELAERHPAPSSSLSSEAV